MINLDNSESDPHLFVFRTTKDNNIVSDKTISIIRDFFSFITEHNRELIIKNFNELSAIIRLILFENYIFKNKIIHNNSADTNLVNYTATTYLGLIAKQKQDIKKFIRSFFQSTDLLYLIGFYIFNKLNYKQNENNNQVIEICEINSLILLNNIIFLMFSNAKQDIKNTTGVDIEESDYYRIFHDMIYESFKIGWYYIDGLALSNIEKYQESLILLLTNILCRIDLSRDVKFDIENQYFKFNINRAA